MWVADWTFQVISPIFSIHWGFLQSTKEYSKSRIEQTYANSRRFIDFKNEVWFKYGKKPDENKAKN
jgi:hypothetical protein